MEKKSNYIITSQDNYAVKLYRNLSKYKKIRRETGLFVFEGTRLLQEAFAENLTIKNLLISESEFFKVESTLTEKIPPSKIIKISDTLAEKISLNKTPQGIFAICENPVKMFNINENGKYLILSSLQDPGNVGTLLRTADALGADGVFLVNCAELFSPKVIKSAMGAAFRLNVFETENETDLFSQLQTGGIKLNAAVIDDSAQNVKKVNFEGGQAIVLGNEGAGLLPQIAEKCDRKIMIKMNGNANSFNVSQAGCILLWEMLKDYTL
ncbi:MAG: RNA methyltransferase [Ruminococcus sp.]|jgi:TrmH family RNA methyltransferase|nr:RNA methyltransferase [Ruminococcus sp.]